LADAVLSGLGFDRLLLIPAFVSPFKPGAEGASPRDRLDMLAASIPADPRLALDDLEIRREGVSYTVDTIAELIRRYRPEGKPALILGDDLARDFHRWKNAGEIADMAELIIARRLSSEPLSFPYPYRGLNNDIMDLSSGMIRERIRQGGQWRSLVPAGARFIIQDRGL
jgi:nicotinate-nucleotide adenylyltransferase